ncbi:MAG: hypothetical protein Q4G04_02195 [bacterium]|nr:hypothetical protein [bacterium]
MKNNNECNDFSKALQIIKKSQKNKPVCCGPTLGPTGATGPTGPTGATGPTGVAPTIDSILVDNDGNQTVASNGLIDLGSVINSTGASLSFTAPNTITFVEPGTYLIHFETLANNTAATGDLGVSMVINGAVIPNASEYVAGTTTESQFVLQHNYTASAGDTLTIENISTVSNDYHDSSLSIIKLG